MSSRLLLNLTLLAIVLGLALFVALAPDKTQTGAGNTISNLDINSVKHATLRRNNKIIIELELVDGNWNITKPFNYAASKFQVTSLLSIANEKSSVTIDPEQHNLEKFGLKKPIYELDIDNTNFKFGSTDPLHFRRYVMSGNKIFLIDDRKYRFLVQEPGRYVRKKLLPHDANIVRLQTGEFDMQKRQQDWTLAPENPGISADDKNRLIELWQNAQAVNTGTWISSDDAIRQSVKITLSDNTVIEFTIARHTNENQDNIHLIMEDPGLVFEIPAGLYQKMVSLEALPKSQEAGNQP